MSMHGFHIEEKHVRTEVRNLRRQLHDTRLTGNARPSAGTPGHTTQVSAGVGIKAQ